METGNGNGNGNGGGSWLSAAIQNLQSDILLSAT